MEASAIPASLVLLIRGGNGSNARRFDACSKSVDYEERGAVDRARAMRSLTIGDPITHARRQAMNAAILEIGDQLPT